MSASPTSIAGASDPAFDYGSIDVGYYDRVFARARGVQSKWHHLKFNAIRSALRSASRHLDIGCGPGTFIGTLGPEIHSTGVDLAERQIAYAQATYGASNRAFQQADATTLPFADGSFDIATSIELIEHLPEAATGQLLNEARRVLRPGGRIVVTTPDYGGLWPALEWLVNRVSEVSYEHQHITKLTRSRLTEMLRNAGYADIRITRYVWLAPFAAALGWRTADIVARIEPRILTRNLGFLLFATARRPDKD